MRAYRMLAGLVLAVSVSVAAGVWAAEPAVTLHVAPGGRDAWSGSLAQPNAARTDGPLASLTGARDRIRQLRAAAKGRGEALGPVTVVIAGGVYRMAQPFVLAPQDSGGADSPVVYEAAQGARPVFSGGQVIGGWQPAAGGLWTAKVPDVAAGKWYFRELFVNGHRRTCARSPNKGYFEVAGRPAPGPGGQAADPRTAFIYKPGDFQPWPDLDGACVVVFHSWEISRLRVQSLDPQHHVVHFTGPSLWPFLNWGPGQRYYIEDVREALDAPGEWYLDRRTGVLTYYPMPGENMRTAEVVAPRLTRLVEIRGDADLGLDVENITFRGLSFQHEDWTLGPKGHSDTQAACTVPAAIMADGARKVVFDNCEIAHVGDYGLWLRHGCKDCKIEHCSLHDLGTGGVRIGETRPAKDDAGESDGNVVDNCQIYDDGHVYPSGVGVWVAQASHNVISHNYLHDLTYSGMSIGWNWNDAPNRCHDNLIEYNRVDHVMDHMLNDGGGIYTLGTSPGSVIRNNVISDVWPYSMFGWGIYLDATTNGYLVEHNIVYNALTGGLMYNNGGHNNVIRNNIFALLAQTALWPCFPKQPDTFEHNIVYITQGEMLKPLAEGSLDKRVAAGESLGTWDHNVYWDTAEAKPEFLGRTFADWQGLGLDAHSVVADPQFVDAANYDFRLKPTSPALAMGFKQIDTSGVGVYGDAAWVAAAKAVTHPRTVLPAPPPPPKPTYIDDNFETTPVGAEPAGASVQGEEKGASIRVTADEAAGGQHSLCITDAPGLTQSWQPHMYYQPHIKQGQLTLSFDLRLEPGAQLLVEGRDSTSYPECIGPSLLFGGDGAVTASGRVLTHVPFGEWVHVQVDFGVGHAATGLYDVSLSAPDEPPVSFKDIAFSGRSFRALQWLGFISPGTQAFSVYIDNLKLQPAGKGK